ncbi:MAG TPA: pitrilysin family protein [Thermoanaerobaculia bacterium]|nr:pitrilysin family protein [Thermoanaerobaculia bacterium]
MKRSIAAFLIALPIFAQSTPPAPAAPRETKVPQPAEKTLDNGLRVIVVSKHNIPLVAARLMVKAGGAMDAKGRDGLASLTSTVLTTGTKTKSAEQIARGVEALGAMMDADAGWDNSTIDLSVMSSNLPKAMEYMADVARNATFVKDEFERERAQAIDALQVNLRQPRTVAGAVASRLIFGDAPYGHTLEGTPQTLEAIKREDLVKFHAANYRPDNAVLVLAGDIKAEEAFKLAQSLFGSWKGSGPKPAAATASSKPAKARVVVIDMPDAGQAAVSVGRQGIRRTDPAYLRALVANSVLGGGYSARLNQEIRIKRGLSYGAGSSFAPRAQVGPFVARTETKNESAADVAGIIVDEMGRLSTSDVPEAELVPRKAVLIGEFGQSLETTSGIVDQISALALHDLPLSNINAYVPGVQAVTAEDVRKFATSNVGSDMNVVVVGDASKFLEPLQKRFGEVEVIKFDELDLNSATLRVRKAKQ